ncbi:MAG: LamG domain-containing protein [Chitinophagaceae bacterium]
MKKNIGFIKHALLVAMVVMVAVSCKKTTQPAFEDYPKDANPPGGPLKFYVAFDGTTPNPLMNAVDSTRANFPAVNTGTSADGISGKCYKGSETAFTSYAGANEFPKSNVFTVALWVKKTPQAAGKGTNFAFSLNKKDYSWTNTKLFLEFEDAGNPSTTDLAAAKFYIMDQWVEYVGANRMPNVLNGSWHQLVFTYNGSNSQFISYIDGVAFKTNTVGTLGPINFGDFDNFTIGGPSQYTHDKNTWMGFFDGQIDQFRLYSTVLTPGEVTTLYNSKL